MGEEPLESCLLRGVTPGGSSGVLAVRPQNECHSKSDRDLCGILASVCLIEIQMLNVANDTLVSREFKNEIYRQKEKQVDYNRGLKLQDT